MHILSVRVNDILQMDDFIDGDEGFAPPPTAEAAPAAKRPRTQYNKTRLLLRGASCMFLLVMSLGKDVWWKNWKCDDAELGGFYRATCAEHGPCAHFLVLGHWELFELPIAIEDAAFACLRGAIPVRGSVCAGWLVFRALDWMMFDDHIPFPGGPALPFIQSHPNLIEFSDGVMGDSLTFDQTLEKWNRYLKGNLLTHVVQISCEFAASLSQKEWTCFGACPLLRPPHRLPRQLHLPSGHPTYNNLKQFVAQCPVPADPDKGDVATRTNNATH